MNIILICSSKLLLCGGNTKLLNSDLCQIPKSIFHSSSNLYQKPLEQVLLSLFLILKSEDGKCGITKTKDKTKS